VRALILSTVSYALPFWNPSKYHLASLQTIILKPLRQVMLLPASTSVATLCAELCLPTLANLREYLLLKHARALHLRPATNRTANIFRADYNTPAATKWKDFAVPFFQELKWVEKRWGLMHNNPQDTANATCMQRTFQLFISSNTKPDAALRALRKSSTTLPNYLLLEPRHIAAPRARLRFGVASVNTILHRNNSTLHPSPNCTHCGALDTIEHMLLHCPLYTTARQCCASDLAAIGAACDLPTLLSHDDEPADSLRVSGAFILYIHSLRDFESVFM
jgi:hypothetical protein